MLTAAQDEFEEEGDLNMDGDTNELQFGTGSRIDDYTQKNMVLFR